MQSMKVLMAEASSFHGPTHLGSHAYAEAFMEDGNTVMWVGTPLHVRNLIWNGRGDDAVSRRRIWKRGGAAVGPNGLVYYPLTLLPVRDKPFLRSSLALRHTLTWTIPSVKRVIRRCGFARPDLLWLSQSRFSQPMRGAVTAGLTAYRMSDDWSHSPHVPRSLIDSEETLLKTVDVLFVTSARLREKVRAARPDAVYLPNGVDEMFFDVEAPEPQVLKSFRTPRVIFTGSMAPWVDWGLLKSAAKRLPEASFILAGPFLLEDARILEDGPSNLHYIGPRPYAEIPSLLGHCQLAVIPFAINPLTHAASPVKLFEYLATGIPVLSSRLDEVERCESPAVLADNGEDFIDKMRGLIEGRIGWDSASAVAYARNHTWRSRYQIIKKAVGFEDGK